MVPYYQDDLVTLYCCDNREVLPELSGVTSVVTDPPYGLAFMGKAWDHGVPGIEFWRAIAGACLPGAPMLAFGGTRTYHRMVCAIEDAGWEIRDCLQWIYGSGFPKSLDVSKAIDKCNGEAGRLLKFTAWMRTTGLTSRQIDDATGTNMGGHYLTAKSQPAIPTRALWALLRPLCGDVPAWVDELIDRIEAEREVVGQQKNAMSGWNTDGTTKFVDRDITAPSTPAARRWSGYGTALKPAYEPICLAMNPLDGTFAHNALEHGVAGLNVDGGRVGADTAGARASNADGIARRGLAFGMKEFAGNPTQGRWPANIIHDGSAEVLAGFPCTKSGSLNAGHKQGEGSFGKVGGDTILRNYGGDSGSAARFFKCCPQDGVWRFAYHAKASKAERNRGCEGLEAVDACNGNKWTDVDYRVKRGERPPSAQSGPRRNTHPTVKPLALMRYLLTLVTMPERNLILDPFAGSGSTGVACKELGIRCILIEQEEAHCEIIAARCAAARRIEKQEVLEL